MKLKVHEADKDKEKKFRFLINKINLFIQIHYGSVQASKIQILH